jgi:hypothetical protein
MKKPHEAITRLDEIVIEYIYPYGGWKDVNHFFSVLGRPTRSDGAIRWIAHHLGVKARRRKPCLSPSN